jgi:integrase
LGALLTAYADQLQRDRKPSARSVRGELHHHVRDKWPMLWAAPITDVTADELLAIVAAPADAGCLRQAEKVRAYLRAAFAAGMRARHNAKALPALRALRVTANPARDLTPIEGANKARDRTLALAELRAYWNRIQGPEYAALRFHLLTGCQRIQQLARATKSDLDQDTGSLRLLDNKGRRASARQHHVPLLSAAVPAMEQMHSGEFGPYVFTLTAGKSGADYAGIFKRVRKVADAMHDAGELPGGIFTPGDLRRTVETRLADVGISRDVRARLQSHGLGGVQERHYDRHDYLPETRVALEALYRLLTGTDAKILPMRRTRARPGT